MRLLVIILGHFQIWLTPSRGGQGVRFGADLTEKRDFWPLGQPQRAQIDSELMVTWFSE